MTLQNAYWPITADPADGFVALIGHVGGEDEPDTPLALEVEVIGHPGPWSRKWAITDARLARKLAMTLLEAADSLERNP